jgi:hypothetical protein
LMLVRIREDCPELEVLHIDNADPLAVASPAGAKKFERQCAGAAGRATTRTPTSSRDSTKPDARRTLTISLAVISLRPYLGTVPASRAGAPASAPARLPARQGRRRRYSVTPRRGQCQPTEPTLRSQARMLPHPRRAAILAAPGIRPDGEI